jgi:hypothetical protein
LYDPDLGSWASSGAVSSQLGGADWISVPRQGAAAGGDEPALLAVVEEATWQEEAHWMSFHQAVQSLVRHSVPQQQQQQEQQQQQSSPGTQSPCSRSTTSQASLVHALARQLVLPATNETPTENETDRKTRLALAQAQQDEWEITNAVSPQQHDAAVYQDVGRSLLLQQEEVRPS